MGQILKYCVIGWTCLLAGGVWGEFALAGFDPTAPPPVRTLESQNQAQKVSGLAWVRVDGKNSIAWYGDTTVKLGERVEGGRVVAIHEDHIVIEGRAGRRLIPLWGSQVQHHPVTLPHSPKRK